MRVCARCGYENADSLTYCFRCGRRLGTAGARPGLGESPTAGFAATVALPTPGRQSQHQLPLGAPAPTEAPAGVTRRAFGALAYVFAYVRGRIDAEDRRRSLAEERRGAERMLDATLAELGATIIASPTPPPALADAIAAIAAARERRETAAADLVSAEKLQAAEDLRLGMSQAAAESEWLACVRGAEEMDRLLRELEVERRRFDDAKTVATNGGEDSAPLAGKGAQIVEELSTLRERASALRASTTAARSKLDQATAARRTAASAMAAGFAAQTRARAEAERAVADLTAAMGRRALKLRLPGDAFATRYQRIDRLQQTIADTDGAVSTLERHIGGYDHRKLVAGVGVLGALLAVAAAGLWAIFR